MLSRAIIQLVIAMLATSVAMPAIAQIKPASSGARSFNAPQMRRYGSGLYRPNQPGQDDLPAGEHAPHRRNGSYER